MSPTKSQKKTPKRTTTKTKSNGFSAEEKAAMRERARELKAQKTKADGEAAVREKIVEMKGSDRVMAERIWEIVKESAPSLSARTWYGMPAWANDEGKIVCYYQDAAKFKARYATFGFNDAANIDQGSMWPTSFALVELKPADEKKLAALVRKAVR